MKQYDNVLMWIFDPEAESLDGEVGFSKAPHIKVCVQTEGYTDFFAFDSNRKPLCGIGYESDFLAAPFQADFNDTPHWARAESLDVKEVK